MVMLPGPKPGALLALHKPSALTLRINQSHITLVRLRLLIQKFKNPVAAGKRHNNTVKLLADLIDRHI